MTFQVFDSRVCDLGEGPLWHPLRQQLFWFDIVNAKLRSRVGNRAMEWSFDRMVSAAGWVDEARMLVASERDLFLFDVDSGTETHVVDLEADNPVTRSNDGRADPQGGFWIGTMGKSAEAGAGAIYRFYKGELRQLYPAISIPNAICFAPDGQRAYFTDTITRQVMRQALDPEGWPIGAPEVHLDLRESNRNPDGAVVDTAGNLWIAEWGSYRVACYAPDGSLVKAVEVGGRHSSCPAFGGTEISTLYVTTALQDIRPELIEKQPENGMVFAVEGVGQGQAEHRVLMD